MHMADAVISPVVGGTMWVASAGLLAWCARKIKQVGNDHLIPMMGVLGAFIFTAQMLNFSIPVTGSSGHLGGGLLLAILLGPHAAFIVIASVLTVQALFFADGGLLALGCNIFNLGFFPAFVAYPFVFRPIAWGVTSGVRFVTGVMIAAVVGLQLGAFGVVIETTISGVSDLPFKTFVMLMQPIHLAIGLVEGLVTIAVATVVMRAGPGVVTGHGRHGVRGIITGLTVAVLIMGCVLSWFASTHPDGLEWAIARISGKEELQNPGDRVHKSFTDIQAKTAILPDYGFKPRAASEATGSSQHHIVDAGKSLSGLLGGLITLALAGLIGYGLKARK